MFAHPEKNKIQQIKNKYKYFTINTSKTPTSNKNKLKNKNQTINNTNNTHTNTNTNSISIKKIKSIPSIINAFIANKNKEKLLFRNASNNNTKLKNYYTCQSSLDNESKNKLKSNIFKMKNFKKKDIQNYYTNFYDIKNNNYYVNLYNTSLLNSKYKSRNSVINKSYYSKNNSRNINNKDISFNTINKTNYYEPSINEIDKLYDSVYIDTKEMLKNYRNKLLKEFIKYLKKFYRHYYKEDFILFINKLKKIKDKKPTQYYVYSKKIQKKPYRKMNLIKKNTYVENLLNKNMIINNKILINKTIIGKSFSLTAKKLEGNEGNSIASKIINNKSIELLDGKIRNIFLDSSFLKNRNKNYIDNMHLNKTPNNRIYSNNDINNTHSALKHRVLLGEILSPRINANTNDNSREIKIDLRLLEKMKKEKNKTLCSIDKKIYLRFNQIKFDEDKNKKNFNYNNQLFIISNLVDSFTILNQKDTQRMNELERRIKYYKLLKNHKFLSSIKEEDEKYSLSIQDSIPAENVKIFARDNLYNNHYNLQNKKNLKKIIIDFCQEKLKKLFINKIKDVACVYKKNKDIKECKV